MAVDDSDDVAGFFGEDMPGYASTTYTPEGGGASSTVPVILDVPQDINQIGRNGVQQEAPQIQMMRASVANPVKGDTWTILAPHDYAGRVFKFGSRTLDASGKIWTIQLNP